MLKKCLGLCFSVLFVLCMSFIVYADSNDNQSSDYVPVMVIFEVFDIETGEVVSVDFFNVYVPEDDYIASSRVINPRFDHPHTITRASFTISSNRPYTSTGILNTILSLGHSRYIIYHSGTLDQLIVEARTIATGAGLGGTIIGRGQALRITIPFNTLSYEVLLGRSHIFLGRTDNVVVSVSPNRNA